MQNINHVVVNEKVYKLQHPGNRGWLQLQQSLIDVTPEGKSSIDIVKLMDYCFENIVFPEKGGKLNLDELPLSELEVWQLLLPRFLRGELDSGYVYPETKKSRDAGQKLLQEVQKAG